MTRVCETWFPKGSYKGQPHDGFYLDSMLKEQIDVLLKNVKNDWDFTIIITGGGEVRIGKSVLAMQIGAYWKYEMKRLHNIETPFSLKDNFVLEGKKLIEVGNRLGKEYPYSSLIFDEAGADLEGRKIMQTTTQDVLDFYRECGQYNLLNILVLPEYFDLPKGIALSRSICLIDVYSYADENDIFQRGFFNFYSRRNKKYLYLKGKKELDYNASKYNFHGRFYNFYPINEKEYRLLKQEALSKRDSRKKNKFHKQRDASWYILADDGLTCKHCQKEIKITHIELAKRMEDLTGISIGRTAVTDAIINFRLQN